MGYPVKTPPVVPKFDDRMKASLASFANLFFLAVVCIIWGLEQAFGGHQLSSINLVIFALGALVLIEWFNLRASPERISALFYMLGRAARSGVAKAPPASKAANASDISRFKRFLCNLWVPVTLNFWLAGWLIYASGGITNSPYAQVPIAMMIVGQGVYDVPPIKLRTDTKVPEFLVFLGGVARLYWYPLILMVCLLSALVGLQTNLPLVIHPAPTLETLLITMVMLFASMCVTFVTRRSDRSAGHDHRELEKDMSASDLEVYISRLKDRTIRLLTKFLPPDTDEQTKAKKEKSDRTKPSG